jgi:hypothetical protein
MQRRRTQVASLEDSKAQIQKLLRSPLETWKEAGVDIFAELARCYKEFRASGDAQLTGEMAIRKHKQECAEMLLKMADLGIRFNRAVSASEKSNAPASIVLNIHNPADTKSAHVVDVSPNLQRLKTADPLK